MPSKQGLSIYQMWAQKLIKDEYKEFYKSDEEDLDSKSDAKVILFLIIVAVVAMTYWVAIQ